MAAPMPIATSSKQLEAPIIPYQHTVKKPTCNPAVNVISSAVSPSSPTQKSLLVKQRGALVYFYNYCSTFLPQTIPLSPANLFSCVLVRMAATFTSNPQAVEAVFALCYVCEDLFAATVVFAKVSRDLLESNPAFARFLCNVGKLDTLGLALERRGQALGYHAHEVLPIMPVKSHGPLQKAPRASEPTESPRAVAPLAHSTAATKQTPPRPATLEATSPNETAASCHPGLRLKRSPSEVAAALANYEKALDSVLATSETDAETPPPGSEGAKPGTNNHELYSAMWNSSLSLFLRYEVAMEAGFNYAAFTALTTFVEKLECVLFYALENPGFATQDMIEYWKVMLHSSLLALDSFGTIKPDVLSLGHDNVEQLLSALTFIKAVAVFYELMNAKNELILLEACNFLKEVVVKGNALGEGLECEKSKEGAKAAAHAVLLLEHFIVQYPYLISPALNAAYFSLRAAVSAFYGVLKEYQAAAHQEGMIVHRLDSHGASGSGPSSGNATPLSNAGAVISVHDAANQVAASENKKKKKKRTCRGSGKTKKQNNGPATGNSNGKEQAVSANDAAPVDRVVKHKPTRRAGVKHRMRKKNAGGNIQPHDSINNAPLTAALVRPTVL